MTEQTKPMSSALRMGSGLVLTVLPYPAVWFGLYGLQNILWCFLLYHGLCLLPAVIWGWPQWRGGVIRPSSRQWAELILGSVICLTVTLALYMSTGELIVRKDHVFLALSSLGYRPTWLLPMSLYMVLVNATLEELFWRGVILNQLERFDTKIRMAGTLWTAVSFAGWHYLVFQLLLPPFWAVTAVILLTGLGLSASWLYRRTGSIILPILWHAFVLDLIVMVLFVRLNF